MLDRVIRHERRMAVDSILRCYEELYLPHVILLPNARFGLYAATKEMLSPGDRVLISPVTCRTVIGALVASEVTPVFVDIEPETGNIDVTKLTTALLDSARAIVTTNLYGNPDSILELKRIADSHGLLLIEDCAHVLQTSIARREIGSVGDVSVFSFKKYFDEPGGVITLRDRTAARKVKARVAAETRTPLSSEERLRFLQYGVQRATPPSIVGGVSRIGRRLAGRHALSRPNAAAESVATATPNCLAVRSLPITASLLRVAGLLQRRQELVQKRMADGRELIAHCPLSVKTSGYTEEVCYLAVPFLSSKRDAIVAQLQQRGIPIYFLYTSRVTGEFSDRCTVAPRLDLDLVNEWCQTILPINPQFSRECLEVFQPPVLICAPL